MLSALLACPVSTLRGALPGRRLSFQAAPLVRPLLVRRSAPRAQSDGGGNAPAGAGGQLQADFSAEQAADAASELLEVGAWAPAFQSPIGLRNRIASIRRLLRRLKRERQLRKLFVACRSSSARDELDFDGLVAAVAKLGELFGDSFVPPEPAVLRHLLDDDGFIRFHDFAQLALDAQADAAFSTVTLSAVPPSRSSASSAPSVTQLLAQRTRSRARPAALRALARVAKGAEERGLTWREMFDMCAPLRATTCALRRALTERACLPARPFGLSVPPCGALCSLLVLVRALTSLIP